MENQLVKTIEESGLDKTKSQIILDKFSNYFDIAAGWEAKAKSIVVTSINDKQAMKEAREGRLFLKNKRTLVESTRKQLKESALREGQTIDAIAKILTNLIIPIEEMLEEKEKFAEREEERRILELTSKRNEIITPVAEYFNWNMPSGSLGTMSEEEFNVQLDAAITKKLEAQREERLRIEKERKIILFNERNTKIAPYLMINPDGNDIAISLETTEEEFDEVIKKLIDAKEKYDIEQNKIREENEKLRRAAEIECEKLRRVEEEKKALEDRIKAQELAKKAEEARIAQEKADAEAAEKKALEEKLAKEEAERMRAALAPDKEKLMGLARQLENMQLPEVSSPVAYAIIKSTVILLGKTADYIRQKSENL